VKRYAVYATCNCHQGTKHVSVINVPDDADADAMCSEMLDQMLGDNFDTGWCEVSDAEIAELKDQEDTSLWIEKGGDRG
jgi:hypothetical protein